VKSKSKETLWLCVLGEIARTRESATAAEGGTHVYLNGKMMEEFTFFLAEIRITSSALSGDTLRP
jgi:hypothetical protein